MTIQEFIEKSIKGGWRYHGDVPAYDENYGHWFVSDKDGGYLALIDPEIFLSPEAWKAVCETGIPESHDEAEERLMLCMPQYKYLMHRMIDYLAYGKTLEEFISIL